MEEIRWVCDDCGAEFGYDATNDGTPRENAMGRCDICGNIKNVSQSDRWGHVPNYLHSLGAIVPDKYSRGRLRWAARRMRERGE